MKWRIKFPGEIGPPAEHAQPVCGELLYSKQPVKSAYVFLQMPDGQANLELIKYYSPSDENGDQQPLANTLGIRYIAFTVEDIGAVVAKLKRQGQEIFGEIQNYEDSYKLCCVRGPEGIILELTEQIEE